MKYIPSLFVSRLLLHLLLLVVAVGVIVNGFTPNGILMITSRSASTTTSRPTSTITGKKCDDRDHRLHPSRPFFLQDPSLHPDEDPTTGTSSSSSSSSHSVPLNGCPKITTITCTEDLLQFLNPQQEGDDNHNTNNKDDGRLCIIKYYASWCKSCAKFGMKYKQLAMTHGDIIIDHDGDDRQGRSIRKGQVRFAQAEYSENRILCRSMGITKLPFVQIYKTGGGKVDEFVCGPRDFNEKVKKRVEELLLLEEEEEEEKEGEIMMMNNDDHDELMFQREMEEGQSLLNNTLLPFFILDQEGSNSSSSSTVEEGFGRKYE